MKGGALNPRTVVEVFDDFMGRRLGLITALTDGRRCTSQVKLFHSRCDPDKTDHCLYAYPDGHWEVKLPSQYLPQELPLPVVGINFARDGTKLKHWLILAAVHCDSWLLSVAFYFSAKYGCDKSKRDLLFDMINDLPTLFETVLTDYSTEESDETNESFSSMDDDAYDFVVEGAENNKVKDESSGNRNSNGGNESMLTSNDGILMKQMSEDEDEDEDEEDEDEEFWICCETCKRSFNGNQLMISSAKAVLIKQYYCSDCNNKGGVGPCPYALDE